MRQHCPLTAEDADILNSRFGRSTHRAMLASDTNDASTVAHLRSVRRMLPYRMSAGEAQTRHELNAFQGMPVEAVAGHLVPVY